MQGYENEEAAKHIQIRFLLQEKQQLTASATLYEQYPWLVANIEKRQAEIDDQLTKLMGTLRATLHKFRGSHGGARACCAAGPVWH